MANFEPELLALFNKLQLELSNGRTFTENAAGAFTSTGDKCLDFFSTVVRSTSVATVLRGFLAAWNEDPDKAVKLLLNLRDVRGGKGEKKVALVLMYALSCWTPLTYLANLLRFLQIGCFKDLLFIAELATRCSQIKAFKRLPQLDDEEAIELKIIACQLKNDESAFLADEHASISLCAKWAPTENSHFDRQPLRFSRKIAKILGIKKKEYRKKLTKLRGHLSVLETLMCTGKVEEIVFKSLPAKAHRLHRKAFAREENSKKKRSDGRVALAKRYAEYLEQLTAGKTSIKSTGIQPHELVKSYMGPYGFEMDEADATIEGQWKDLVARLAESGHFNRVQAVCDVSGSMDGTPMEVAIALGLVVSELTSPPFRNTLISFSAEPVIHSVTGSTLRERVACLEGMPFGYNTDLIKVFELLLAQAESQPGSQMVEKLFIFTDMQFDEAEAPDGQPRAWATTYQHILRLFGKTRHAVPKIIFWNLRATKASFPLSKDEEGVALVSGFSAAMLKAFLENKEMEAFNPLTVMNETLDKYEITPVPREERFPIPGRESDGWTEAFGVVERVVEEFLTPKRNDRVKKRA
ncbi:hypothetical protein BV898_03885 [Hypsibius exemplaris]|uniref:TROVE domain-containing protein n=1 Tax=Hypsibius exemplaris TaxID=2072580 RepID=A0A1W0X3N9_HYPEX|nr:hypothetical protein BV898_03885 [Hypsibius exemplaris]